MNSQTRKHFSVWIDVDIDSELLGALLYEHDPNLKLEVNEISASLYSIDGRTGQVEQDKLISALSDLSAHQKVVIVTNKPTQRSYFISPDQSHFVISAYALGEEEFDVRLLALTVFRAAVVEDYYHAGVPSNYAEFRSFELSSEHKEIEGRIKYSKPVAPCYVVITHGIRTYAPWAESSYATLDSLNIGSQVFRYDWVDLANFLLYPRRRTLYGMQLLKRINAARSANPEKRLAVAAHSFGTMVLSKALELADDIDNRIEIDAIILAGSILPSHYDWDRFTQRGKSRGVTIRRVLNLCGDSDPWPVAAKYFAPGAGNSGTFFFADNYSEYMTNHRIESADHSSILHADHVEEIWGRYLLNSNFRPAPNNCFVTSEVLSVDKWCARIRRLVDTLVYAGLLAAITWSFASLATL